MTTDLGAKTHEAVMAAHQSMLREFAAHGLVRGTPLIDKIAKLPKKVIYRLSYDGLRAEAQRRPRTFARS